MKGKYDGLKLENQLCFPLYACAKEIVRRYTPLLAELDLTYTQYITMMVLWEQGQANVKELGKRLLLDSGTLTPLLKKLEAKGYITRERSSEDERNLSVRITDKGLALRDKARDIPKKMASCVSLEAEDALTLKRILNDLMQQFGGEE
ncbi:MAG: MarR family transcriptional regulator [Treponema sp.]|nr:MarR family transcriptional regulator [Treponema sp.]